MTPEQIAGTRARLGLTQAQFAERINLAVPGLSARQKDVSYWETGEHKPSGPAAVAIASLAADAQPVRRGMSAEQLAMLIRIEGFTAVANVIVNPVAAVQRAVSGGWDVTGWELVERTGVGLFAHFAGAPAPVHPEIAAMEAERRGLQREERLLLAGSHHDGDARRRRDAARNRINTIDHALPALVASLPPAPERTPIEGVLCLAFDLTPEVEATLADASYPIIVLHKDDWLPQSELVSPDAR